MKQQNFYIDFDGERNVLTGKVVYSQDARDLKGMAKVYMPYADSTWKLVEDGINVKIMAGVDGVAPLFNGVAKRADRQGNEVVVELNDFGEKFKRPYSGTYTGKEFEKVVQEIGGICEHAVIFDRVPEYVLKKKISRSVAVEKGLPEQPSGKQTGNTGLTISGSFHPSCSLCVGKFIDRSYVSTVRNSCPKCGVSGELEYQADEDCFYCKSCTTSYCGVCGHEKIAYPTYKLTLTYGPSPGESWAKEPAYSPSGTTCEQELRNICTANNQYFYITPEEQLVIREFNGYSYPDYIVQSTEIEEPTFSHLKNLTNKIKGVTIEYNGGKVVADLANATDDPSKERIVMLRNELTRTDAQKLANNILLQELQDLQTDAEIVTHLNAGYIPGKWLFVPFFSKEISLNIIFSYHTITPTTMTTSMRMRMYPSTIVNEDLYTSLHPTDLRKDLIITTAAKYDFSYICTTDECLRQRKYGDTEAMSYYLYNMLRKVGEKIRIMSYDRPDLMNKKQYYVQVYQKGTWEDFDYEGNQFDPRFYPSVIRNNLKVVKS